jgi:hypothetical protein
MLEQKWADENQEIDKTGLNNSKWRIDTLAEEIRVLDEAKTSLLEIEKTLWFKIDDEIRGKRQKKELLKAEVTDLKQRCDMLLYFVNAVRQE